MAKVLNITINEQGIVNIDMAGFTGKACTTEQTSILKDLANLGISSRSKQIKPKTEYYKQTQKGTNYARSD